MVNHLPGCPGRRRRACECGASDLARREELLRMDEEMAENYRLQTLLRQWKVLRSMAKRPYVNATALANSLGVTERTVRRDIHMLRAAGFKIQKEYTEAGRFGPRLWRLDRKDKRSQELAEAIA